MCCTGAGFVGVATCVSGGCVTGRSVTVGEGAAVGVVVGRGTSRVERSTVTLRSGVEGVGVAVGVGRGTRDGSFTGAETVGEVVTAGAPFVFIEFEGDGRGTRDGIADG